MILVIRLFYAGFAGLVLVSATACGRFGSGGSPSDPNTLTIDGSSTVYPIVSGMADDYGRSHREVNLIVNSSGTGSGIQKFIRGEIDVAAASRPIDQREVKALGKEADQLMEIPFAIDGVSVVVNDTNTWAKSLTLDQLKSAWKRGSSIQYWSDLNPRWPHAKISFYGPTDNHGTYDYFSDAVGSNSLLRNDVQTNQEYNAIVQAVVDDPNGIGYVGLAYYSDNSDRLRACAIDFGKGPVMPTAKTVASGAYAILSRPLLLYVKKDEIVRKPAVADFVSFALSDQGVQDVGEAHCVALSPPALEAVKKRVKEGKTGTVFIDRKDFSPDRIVEAESK